MAQRTQMEQKLYIDGNLFSQATANATLASQTFSLEPTLGNDRQSGGRGIKGLDQVRFFNKALSSSEATTLYGENNASSTKSTTDIFEDGSGVALYEFEKGAKDTGGVNGYIGSAGVFNGSNSKIDIGSLVYPVSLKGTINELSISLWFKSNASPTASEEFVTWWSGGAGDVYLDGFLGLTSSNTIRFGDGWNSAYTFPNTNYVGNWTHIVAVKSSNNAYLYINGSLVATKGSSLSWGFNRNLIIGGDQGGAEYFNGSLDQIRLFNKAISSSEVTTLYGETSASATKSTTDIFDDGSGVALYELEGNANDSGRFGSGAIDSGQSAVFNGSSYVNTGITNTIADRTFSIWFYYAGAPSSVQNLMGAVTSASQGYEIRLSTTEIMFTQQAGTVARTSLNNLNINAWNNVIGIIDGSITKLYINGFLKDTGAPSTSGTHSLYIGANQENGVNQYFTGKIDQVRIYSTALSDSQILALISETNVPTTNLLAHYKFDGNANDETGNYNGTASNITYSDPAEFPTYDGTATNVSYGYDGTPTNVSFVGTSFQPDLVWLKSRSNASWSHFLQDSIRGAENFLISNSAGIEGTTLPHIVDSFDTNGFTVLGNGNSNNNGDTYVAWCWESRGCSSIKHRWDNYFASFSKSWCRV